MTEVTKPLRLPVSLRIAQVALVAAVGGVLAMVAWTYSWMAGLYGITGPLVAAPILAIEGTMIALEIVVYHLRRSGKKARALSSSVWMLAALSGVVQGMHAHGLLAKQDLGAGLISVLVLLMTLLPVFAIVAVRGLLGVRESAVAEPAARAVRKAPVRTPVAAQVPFTSASASTPKASRAPVRAGSDREDQIAQAKALRATGLSYARVAEQVGLPLTTVKRYAGDVEIAA